MERPWIGKITERLVRMNNIPRSTSRGYSPRINLDAVPGPNNRFNRFLISWAALFVKVTYERFHKFLSAEVLA